MSQKGKGPGRVWRWSPSPDSSHPIPPLASLAETHNPPADIRLAATVDTTRFPGRSPTQGHLLSQRGDPGSRSPDVPITLLGGGHSGRLLGTDGHPSRYSIELIRAPQFLGVQNTPTPLEGPQVLANEVRALLRKGAVVPTPSRVRSRYYSTYFWYPRKTAVTGSLT